MQPLIINLTGKKVVIAGGGRIAARKAQTLADQRAEITFVAPHFCEEILELSNAKNFSIIKRIAHPNDFAGAFLVILATNVRSANKALANQLSPNQLVCVVDESDEGNVSFPATIQRGHLQVAVTSNGASPKLTRKLKKELEKQFDHSWGAYSEFLLRCRKKLKELNVPLEERNKLLEEILDERYRLDKYDQEEILERLSKIGPFKG
ncbi:potassium transporter Trk [Cytobacillus depressus]|uniref:precorrin-2 dehydrogenase n=1 Tax=Cytobacillus depressus TaxID=1602942 RepID=A0A6L3V3W6_9BACI|nr:NAD(P)-dependent oxidoreductase [Cytobacillus depressus]KAB2332131.1 potassium transporter Trk [Cytobacillus depressus]